MRVMLDTNGYSAFKKGHAQTVEILRRADEILVPVPVLGELRVGFRAGNREEENLEALQAFLFSPRVRIHPLGEETAIFYSEIHGALKKAGKPIPINDLWIASAALECGAILVSRDTHFDLVPGIVRR
jgi:predicted nucleic acid-binding protein